MRTARTLGLTTCLALALLPAPSRAGFTPYLSAVDAGAGAAPVTDPRQQLPLSTVEAQRFDTAAALLGTLNTANLGAANGTTTDFSLGGGLTVTLSGVKTNLPASVAAGIVTANPNPVTGFSVTSENGPFLRITPDATNPAVQAATATFTFSTPVQAFGAYVLGLGTAPGTFHLLVYDGSSSPSPVSYPITGDSQGGALFVGFTDPGAGVSKVAFQVTGFSSTSRDIVSLDGIRFVTAVPEPSPALLLAIGGLILVGARRRIGSRGR